jgi:selT/selW/selH-like putative selenoprotein
VSSDPTRHRLEIAFCDLCGSREPALELARQVLDQWASELAGLTLIPTADERFDVVLDGEPIFSMAQHGRHPDAAEINTILESRLGPPPGFGA